VTIPAASLADLRSAFGERLQENVSLERYSAARIGGSADYLVTIQSAVELAEIAKLCWEQEIPFIILGSGSNVLVADRGVRELVVINHARKITFNQQAKPASVTAESGVNFGALARKAAARGLSGLEWAAGIPGTVGGAVYGNAGAHGADMRDSLLVANILHLKPSENGVHHEILPEEWPVEKFDYGYRSSSLKRQPGRAVILSAKLTMIQSSPEAVQAKMDEYRMMRRSSQPTGASLGSIFKNPPGDHAGRLIEAAGLKGMRLGGVEVSKVHANFFINQGNAKADDYAGLIKQVQQEVLAKSGVRLELEIELIGEWSEVDR
jgi:UDP-N-acetylmuramate dehydrogenase